MTFEEFIMQAREMNASDIHLTVGAPTVVRVNGELRKYTELSDQVVNRTILSILSAEQEKMLTEGKDIDFSFELKNGARQRVNVFRQSGKLAACIRLLNAEIPTLEELKMPPVLLEFAKKRRGLVLVTGPTGAGKSTTLAALMEYINKTRACHVITIEDPIEYRYKQEKATIHQRELGRDVPSFHEALRSEGIDPAAFTLLPSGHEAVAALLGAVGYVDVVIPRGGAGLIRFVRENARIPVIETGAGIVHTYFDADGDLAKGRAVVCNAKTRRVSVCNALDCLIVHRSRLGELAELCDPMAAERVTIYADAEAYAALAGRYPACQLRPAGEEHFGTEFLDYKLAVKTVGSLDEALAHIERYSSRHSEAIVTENAETARQFTQRVDAACVYVNVSTAFTDGGQFGFGAEVGISTQKLHARGPMGLPELTTYKYVVSGDGQTREP